MPIFGRKDTSPPDPTRTARPSQARATSEQETNDRIRKAVQCLMAPPTPEEGLESERVIRAMAEQVGYYVTAAKVRVALDALSSNRNAPTGVSFKIIYRIVADLMGRHIERELAGVLEGHTPIGPNIFGSYCSDLLENTISGRGIVAAVQEAVSLTEMLIRQIIDNPGMRVILVPFAEVLIRDARDQVEAASGRRTPVPRKRSPGEDDAAVKAQLIASWDAARYMGEFSGQVLSVCNGFSTFTTIAVPTAAEVGGAGDRNRIDAYIGYLLALIDLSTKTGYLPLAAMAHQRAGRVLWAYSADRGRENFHTAAAEFELLGDREVEHRLTGLAAQRYQRAAEIFGRLNAAGDAQRAREKFETLASANTPRQS